VAGVKLEGVTKVFGNFMALAKTDLEIRDGEFLVLVGPSGCGKTTTLRIVAGLEMPTTGDVYIGQTKVTNLEPKDRDIAMVFQSYALYPHMNVFDNMAFGLKLRKMPRSEIDSRVREAADMLGLGSYLDRYPKQLSGGQRQRVALGRAIVRHPKVFLMDEPLSNLDAKLRVQTRAELIKLHQRLKTTVIYVTHDQTEAMTMGMRIVVMKDGVVQQVGAPADIYNQPDNVFVAGFIGSPPMNFISGEVEVSGGKAMFRSGGVCLGLDAPDIPLPAKAILGIRPESLTIAPPFVEERAACATCLVEVVENIGSETIVHSRTKADELLVLKTVGQERIPAMGDTIKVLPYQGNIHLFDAQTGVRVFSKKCGEETLKKF